MKKVLLIEILVSIVYTVCMPQLWSKHGYFMYTLTVFLMPFLSGYIFAVCYFLFWYIISLFRKTKLPKINKVACIAFWIIFIGLACADIYRIYVRKDNQNAESNVEEVTKKDNSLPNNQKDAEIPLEEELNKVNKDVEVSADKKQMQKYMKGILEDISINMFQNLPSRTKNMDIPDSIVDKTYLIYSKEKLSAAINKQYEEIKQYKEDVKNISNEMIDDNVTFALLQCVKKYREDLCKETIKPFKRVLVKRYNMALEPVDVYVDYLEEELKFLRFIDSHYDKFRITEKGPYFTEPDLQAQHIANANEVKRKVLLLDSRVKDMLNTPSNQTRNENK